MAGEETTSELVEWQLNGKNVQSAAGSTILEAAREQGVEIPTFCYHPGLSIAGNCRMCLVETNRSPKPAISCSERIAPGLEVQTHSAKAVEARNAVLEFQLINHPLDCPICDKAGECRLQDHSYDHGPDRSRFVESKNIRHTKELGPTIKIWGNRCIVCTRCVRFCDEISGTGELCVVQRGDRSVVDTFPGLPIDNPLAGNVVDICPVGALISRDFLFQSRQWFLEQTESVCAGCSRGCNIVVECNEGFIKRLRPRENSEVNEWWMCDFGRHDYRYAHAQDRVAQPQVAGTESDLQSATHSVADHLRAAAPERTLFLVDPFLTCEELYLAQRLADRAPGSVVAGWLPPTGEEFTFPAGFRVSSERCPNRTGAEAIFGSNLFTSDLEDACHALLRGAFDLVIAFVGFPKGDPPCEVVEAAAQVERLVVFALQPGAWCDGAAVLLPSASPFEKEGTYVNEDGRLQRVRSKERPHVPRESMPGLHSNSLLNHVVIPELALLQEVQIALGERERRSSSAGVFRELAARASAFHGLTHRDVGAKGIALPALGRRAATVEGGAS